MPWTTITLKPGYTIDDAWATLEASGITPLFSNEDPDGMCEIVLSTTIDPDAFSFCLRVQSYVGSQDIDWTAQWEAHGHNFFDGMVHIDIGSTKTLKLVPGPGFGDLSHPTTCLVLAMMTNHVKDKFVLDIGCGSGILTLATAMLGARHAYGVDIDDQAIAHASKNAALNGLEGSVTFCLPRELPSEGTWVVVINMIWSEQQQAWPQWLPIASKAQTVIVSGILDSERDAYLEYVQEWGWRLAEEKQQDQWLAFRFLCGTAIP